MSLGVGVVSSSKNMVFDGKKNGGEGSNKGVADLDKEIEQESVGENIISRQMSECSIYTTDNDEEDFEGKIQLGPKVTLKEQYEKDKTTYSGGIVQVTNNILGYNLYDTICAFRAVLLKSYRISATAVNYLCNLCLSLLDGVESLDPEVKILSLAIKSPGRPDIILPIPETGNPKGAWFTLKEGSKYNLKFTFQVSNNIVSGLKYKNTVWKTGLKVDSAKEMIGTFSPQTEPYTHEMPDETTPSGMFARGSYSARTKFLDDDNKCYLEINYTFEIKKEWQST
ncbi:hypothetical protein Leryth_019659 [Lithospermum erythrorhizon]|nr:hypothetical protein Leryth_019659 [Lithospermum erythrorhizon]